MLTRETLADIACAIGDLPWVDGIHAFDLQPSASGHPDALHLAIVLSPYRVRDLVATHYALLAATSHQVTGRVLYVNKAWSSPVPLKSARRVVVAPEEKQAALQRIAARREVATRVSAEALHLRRDVERAFRAVAHAQAEQPFRIEKPKPRRRSPYRRGKPLNEYNQEELQALVEGAFDVAAVVVQLDGTEMEVVDEPFAQESAPTTAAKRVLVIDDDLETARALARSSEVEAIVVSDGWQAIDAISANAFDLVICAVIVGELTGAQLFRMAVKARPEMAKRFVFLANESAVASARPETVGVRVVARPLELATVRRLLDSAS